MHPACRLVCASTSETSTRVTYGASLIDRCHGAGRACTSRSPSVGSLAHPRSEPPRIPPDDQPSPSGRYATLSTSPRKLAGAGQCGHGECTPRALARSIFQDPCARRPGRVRDPVILTNRRQLAGGLERSGEAHARGWRLSVSHRAYLSAGLALFLVSLSGISSCCRNRFLRSASSAPTSYKTTRQRSTVSSKIGRAHV